MGENTMKRRFGRPLAMAASAALACALMVPAGATTAMADNLKISNTDVTITGLEKGDTVTAYTIATASVDEHNNLSFKFDSDLPNGYQTWANWSSIQDDGYSYTKGSAGTDEAKGDNTKAQEAAAAAASVKSQLATAKTETDSDKDGKVTLSLGPGIYLVQVTDTSGTTTVYQNMVVNLTPKATGEGKDSSYTAADNVTFKVKATPVEVTKVIGQTLPGSETVAPDAGKESTDKYKVGDSVPFTITTAIPNYPSNSQYATFTITDNPTNMTVNESSNSTPITVKVGGTVVQAGSNSYTLSVQDGNMTITFAKDYVLQHQGESVVVNYSAKITTAASVTNGQAVNDVKLEFNPNPYESATKKPGDKVTDTTYGYVFKKLLGTGSDQKVGAGAQFTLYKKNGDNYETASYTVNDGTGHNINAEGVITADASGYVYVSGLPAGSYKLVETHVPSGYQKVEDIEFTLSSENATNDNPATSDVTETNFLVKDEDVIDPPNGILPQTGEMGNFLLIAGGIVLVAGGAVIIARSRNRKQEQE